MKLLRPSDLTDEEYGRLRQSLGELYGVCRTDYDRAEWRRVRSYFKRGVEAGAYSRDAHGVSGLLWRIETCQAIAVKVGLRRASLVASLLSPVMQAGLASEAELRRDVGDDAVHLMTCMGRVQAMQAGPGTLEDEGFRALLLSMAEDLRVIICLIADSYALMRLLNHNPDTEYRGRVTRWCRLFYTPMAHRLGLYAIKQELEDMAVKYEHRDVYDQIARDLDQTKRSRDAYIKAFIAPIEQRLHEVAPTMRFHIKGRTKSISSIWNKLKAQQTTIDRIYDLFAIRIIIDEPDRAKEKSSCWQAYSVVTDMYVPNTRRLKDWLSIPKSNGYESLHITVSGPEGRWVEVQIRTQRMDDIAERGVAAHWLYKGVRSEGEGADQVMASIREILEQNADPDDLMRDLHLSVYKEEIFVFTPKGDVCRLPGGATVLDLAFSIHSSLGEHCVGARISGRNAGIGHVLHSGDTVEVLTSSSQSPKADWLALVTTGKARTRIRQSLKEAALRAAETGRELLSRRLANRRIELSDADLSKLILRMGYKTQTEFYHALATGSLTVDDVLRAYAEMQQPATPAGRVGHSAEDFDLALAEGRTAGGGAGATGSGSADTTRPGGQPDVLVIDSGVAGIDYTLAGCCHPIYGDDVVGFVSVAGGIRIHRAGCSNVRNLGERYPYRIVPARWAAARGGQYSITLRVVGQDDIGIVSNISSVINKERDTLLRAISIDSDGGLFQGHLTVMVADTSSLTQLVKKIKAVRGVKSVERLN